MKHRLTVTSASSCFLRVLCVAAVLLLFLSGCDFDAGHDQPQLIIAVASSMQDVAEHVVQSFERLHPTCAVHLNIASTGKLVGQIQHHAPIDVLISAGPAWMNRLEDAGLLEPDSRRTLAGNDIVLIVPRSTSASLSNYSDLANDSIQRIAMGDPALVPGGQYAKDLLEQLDLWECLSEKLIFSANVRQTLEYTALGEVDAGLVFASDAQAASRRVQVVQSRPLEEKNYEAAVIVGAKRLSLAGEFVDHLAGPKGRAALEDHGFRVE